MKKPATLRIHNVLTNSFANGPGRRYVIWTQGCSLHCPGCFNPETHAEEAKTESLISEIFSDIQEQSKKFPGLEGVTISGGEPLQQFHAVLDLLQALRAQTSLSAILFTGYTLTELERDNRIAPLSKCVDVLIAGRYEQSKRVAKSLMGSSNKKVVFFTQRYQQVDLDEVPESEVIISADGDLVMTGIEPMRLRDEVEVDGLC